MQIYLLIKEAERMFADALYKVSHMISSLFYSEFVVIFH